MELTGLDTRLQEDTFPIGKVKSGFLLLSKNVDVYWFIIVPIEGNTPASDTEFFQLPDSLQHQVVADANAIAAFLKQRYQVDKINIASIGNVVSQMHFHVVGRYQTDPYWPQVVWGQPVHRHHPVQAVDKLTAELKKADIIVSD